jgi:two-component system response regulator HydG
MKKILLLEPKASNKIFNLLQKNDFDVDVEHDEVMVFKLIKDKAYNLLILDSDYSGKLELDYFKKLKSKASETPIIVICHENNPRKALSFVKAGAFDCLLEPLNREEVLNQVILAANSINSEMRIVSSEKKTSDVESFDYQSSKSPILKNIEKYIEKISPTDISVLIQGETGSGKEVYAKLIHERSLRKDKPFIALDCGAIPSELADSEFFGHVKGSFTGAIKDKIGAFQEANGGTLFLDEIGNLQYNNQLKLLRALQERIITKVGDFKEIKVDVRVIAATNDDIFTLVDNNDFREDVFYRINEFRINIPPLRNRREDMDDFIDYFIEKYNKRFNKNVEGIDIETRELIKNYSWPGNIRELSNVIKRAVLLSEDTFINKDLFPSEVVNNRISTHNTSDTFINFVEGKITAGKSLREITAETEKIAIEKVLNVNNKNKTESAKMLDVDRKTLYNKIDDYKIKT